MLKKSIKIVISLCIGALFLWLAFRNVAVDELLKYFERMSYGWLAPYFILVIISHWARAERWLLLLKEEEGVSIKKRTLFTGVMLGYSINYVVPRLGEISRSVYVAKRQHVPTSTLVGTVVLERILDLLCLGIIMLIVGFYLISDITILQNIFGQRIINYVQNFYSIQNILMLFAAALVAVFALWGGLKLLDLLSKKYQWLANLYDTFQRLNRTFLEGILSLRNVDNWWSFAAWTGLIWFGCILLVYIPFWMFDLQKTYH